MNLEQRIWLACAIDTDGYLGIKNHRYKSKGKYYTNYLPAIGFGNTNRDLVLYFGLIIGVKPSPAHKNGNNPKNKEKSVVHIHNTKIILNILQEILPYLIAKKEKAEFLIRYCLHRLEPNPLKYTKLFSRNDKDWYDQWQQF